MSDNLLRRLVLERHWTYSAFVTQFERAATLLSERDAEPRLGKLTISEKTFKRWTSGEIQSLPMPDVRRVLEFMFEQSVQALFGPADAAISLGSLTGMTSPNTLGSMIHMAAQRSLRYATLMQGSDITADGIGLLQEEAARIALVFQREPLSEFIADLLDLQDLSFRALEGKYRPDQARDLHLLAAMACGMLAKASHDVADTHSAMSNARAAYLCAEQSGHDGLMAWVRALMSLVTYWAGRHSQAIRYAQLGESITGAVGGATVWLPSLEARAHAAVGDARSTLDAIDRVHRARENLSTGDLDGLGNLFAFPLEKQNYYIAEALVQLGSSTQEAAEAADVAVSGYLAASDDVFEWSSLAGAQASQAISRIAHGELDGAQEALNPVLTLAPDLRINGIRVCVDRVYRHLPPGGASSPRIASDLRESIEDYSRTGPKAIPPVG